jgi:hypothetical protein
VVNKNILINALNSVMNNFLCNETVHVSKGIVVFLPLTITPGNFVRIFCHFECV